VFFLWRFLRGMRRRPAGHTAAAASSPAPAGDKYADLLEQELEKRR
jgi:hypothetical protein